KSGQIARNSFKIPKSEQYKCPPYDGAVGVTSKGNLPIILAVPDTSEEKSDRQEIYVLILEPVRFIREAVKCGKVTETALIDTGTAVTVIWSVLLEKTEFVKKLLNGPKNCLVNGHTLSPQSTADIVVTHRGKTIKGNPIVVPMSGFELLLGNDLLQQFQAIHIDYESKVIICNGKITTVIISNKMKGSCIGKPSGSLLVTTSLLAVTHSYK
ncbi:Uncharacterized protein APZ42_026181, partial [Daphnia magna]